MTSLAIATISINVAIALGVFGAMLLILTNMGNLRVEVRDELHAVRLEMRDLREETREELRRLGERLTGHEQSAH